METPVSIPQRRKPAFPFFSKTTPEVLLYLAVPIWIDALALAVVGSVGGLLTASILIFVSQPLRDRVVPWLVSYAVGTCSAPRCWR
jgi:hypothetical protein